MTSTSDETVFQSGGVGFWVASHAMIAAHAPGSFTPGKTMFVPGANSGGDAKKSIQFFCVPLTLMLFDGFAVIDAGNITLC
ncbi:hypothetical protein NDJ23_18135 [Vibrio alginolyticus]|nr:hypothetical protein [Vibrio alginolyticus]MCS0271756.1 hypothetical protein [Vibrio alginolyticus]